MLVQFFFFLYLYFAFPVIMLISVSFGGKTSIILVGRELFCCTTDCIGLVSDSRDLAKAGASAGLTFERAFTVVIY